MRVRNDAFGHKGRRDRDIQLFGEPNQHFGRMSTNDAIAGEHDRAGGFRNNACGFLDLFWRGSAEVGPLHEQRLAVGFHTGHVFGDFDVRGAGLFGLRQLEGFAEGFGNDVGRGQAGVPLCHRAE